jgi:molybdopterin synthase sulfur carrier subunit
MTTKLVYFAWMREKTGKAQEDIELPDGLHTVADLIEWQKGRGPEYAAAFARADVVRAAIDHEHVPHDAPIAQAREIAFFPPVTGG